MLRSKQAILCCGIILWFPSLPVTHTSQKWSFPQDDGVWFDCTEGPTRLHCKGLESKSGFWNKIWRLMKNLGCFKWTNLVLQVFWIYFEDCEEFFCTLKNMAEVLYHVSNQENWADDDEFQTGIVRLFPESVTALSAFKANFNNSCVGGVVRDEYGTVLVNKIRILFQHCWEFCLLHSVWWLWNRMYTQNLNSLT